MPDDGYEVRYDDPRVGYFLTYVNDMTETGTTNYRDMINRWRLVKKNPRPRNLRTCQANNLVD